MSVGRKSAENRRSDDVGKARADAIAPGRPGSRPSRGENCGSACVRDAPGKNTTLTSSVNSSALVMGPSHPPFCTPGISSVFTAAAASETWKRSEAIIEACRLMAASFTASHAGKSSRDARAATDTRRPGAARRALSGAVARRRARRPPAGRLTAVGATAAPASAATAPAATDMGLMRVKNPKRWTVGEMRRSGTFSASRFDRCKHHVAERREFPWIKCKIPRAFSYARQSDETSGFEVMAKWPNVGEE